MSLISGKSSGKALFNTLNFIATAGQTVFPFDGRTVNEQAAVVYKNGIRLFQGEYSITSTDVTLTTPCALNDKVVVDTTIADIQGSKTQVFTETFTGNGSATAFTFVNRITSSAPASYQVFLDGVHQNPDTAYTINLTNQSIVFTVAPGNSVVIVVRVMVEAQETATVSSLQASVNSLSTEVDNVLPPITGNALKVLRVNTGGTDIEWGDAGQMYRSARTSNTVLGLVDKGYLIDITSGTFTQTFSSVTTLGNGWFCYIKNSGTGDITLDPAESELIDGLTSYIMYPNEVRLIQCDGITLRSIVIQGFNKTFTSSDNFIKPPGYSLYEGLLWGGGGAGSPSMANQGGGGGGGACVPFKLRYSDLSASVSVIIGSGGLASLNLHTDTGAYGGNSSFSNVIAYGGGGGVYDGANTGRGGNGGGTSSAPTLTQGGAPLGGVSSLAGTDSTFGGAFGGFYNGTTSLPAGQSIYGGGGGLRAETLLAYKGYSLWGGGGGYGSSTSRGFGPDDSSNYLNTTFTQICGLSGYAGRGAVISSLLAGKTLTSPDTSSAILGFGIAGRTAGDLLVAVLSSTHASDATPTAPVGWALEISVSGGAGAGTTNNTGIRRTTVYTKISDGTESNVTFTLTGGVDLTGQTLVLRKDASAPSIATAFATGTDTTIGTTFTATTGSIDIQENDIVFARASVNSSAGTWTNTVLSGFSSSIMHRLADSNGGNISSIGACALASAPSNGSVTFTATVSAATSNAAAGSLVVIRFRGCSEVVKTKIAQAPAGGGCGSIPGARGELRIWGVV